MGQDRRLGVKELMVLLSFSRQETSPMRSLSRSFSDPSRYQASYSEDEMMSEDDHAENQEMANITENGEDMNPWLPRERSPSK